MKFKITEKHVEVTENTKTTCVELAIFETLKKEFSDVEVEEFGFYVTITVCGISSKHKTKLISINDDFSFTMNVKGLGKQLKFIRKKLIAEVGELLKQKI